MLVVCTNRKWNVRVREYSTVTIWFRCGDGALNVLLTPKTYINGRIPQRLQKLGTRMLVEHTLAESPKFFPFVTTIL